MRLGDSVVRLDIFVLVLEIGRQWISGYVDVERTKGYRLTAAI